MNCGGFKLNKTIESIKIVLKSIPMGSMFNICTFGSEHSSLFGNKSAPYNEGNYQKAITKLDAMVVDP